jgi:hypothetical protein
MAVIRPKGKGAPASARSVRYNGELTQKAKSVINKARFSKLQAEAQKALGPPARKGGGVPLVVKVEGKPRPTEFDEVLALEVCRRFATDPRMSLGRLNLDPTLPTVMTFYEWLEIAPHIAKTYTRAREAQADIQAEEMRETAANPRPGEIRIVRTGTDSLGRSIDSEEIRYIDSIERAKLMVSTEQWLLAKLRPKKYGVQPIEIEGNDSLKDLLAAFRKRNEELGGNGTDGSAA